MPGIQGLVNEFIDKLKKRCVVKCEVSFLFFLNFYLDVELVM